MRLSSILTNYEFKERVIYLNFLFILFIEFFIKLMKLINQLSERFLLFIYLTLFEIYFIKLFAKSTIKDKFSKTQLEQENKLQKML